MATIDKSSAKNNTARSTTAEEQAPIPPEQLFRMMFERVRALRERIKTLTGRGPISCYLDYIARFADIDTDTALSIYDCPSQYDCEAAAVARLIKLDNWNGLRDGRANRVQLGPLETDLYFAFECWGNDFSNIDSEISRYPWEIFSDPLCLGVRPHAFLMAWLPGRVNSDKLKDCFKNIDQFSDDLEYKFTGMLRDITLEKMNGIDITLMRHKAALELLNNLKQCNFDWREFSTMNRK